MMLYNPNIDLVNDNVLKNWLNYVHSFSIYIAQTNFWCKLRAVTLLQNLWKIMFYNSNVDFVHDDVYTKFGKILSIYSQDIEHKPISDVNRGS